MSDDLIPLFLFKEKGSSNLKQANVALTVNGEAYKPSSFIRNVAEEIEPNVEGILSGIEMGEITVAAYVLLESLHRTGMAKMSEDILEDPHRLFAAAVYTAIGMRAGMVVPEGARFETITSDSDLSVRDITS